MPCIISRRAQAVIEIELAHFPDTETGGLLLGRASPENDISILEATDSGYQNTIHTPGSFQYDAAYEEHLCCFLSQLYQPPLQLIGVWHKHNSAHSNDSLPFSSADEKIHRQLMENSYPCVSVLFEKTSKGKDSIHYDTRIFLLSPNGKHRDITDVTVWGKGSSPTL